MSKKDEGMLNFIMSGFEDLECFESDTVLPSDLSDCFEWMNNRSAEDAILYRETIMSAIEKDAQRFIDTGLAAAWFGDADSQIKKVSQEVNGPLLELLLKVSNHVDMQCPELFRQGAPLLGKLPMSGIGRPEQSKPHESVEKLYATAEEGNLKIAGKLKQDEHSGELFSQTLKSAEMGRMTAPRPIEEADLSSIRVSQRFSVKQGLRKDGSVKVRCVDGCTESGVNPCTEKTEHLELDNLDFLFEVMRQIWQQSGTIPHVFKADIDSAYCRVPIMPQHRWAANVIFAHDEKTYVAGHLAMPFGATSSVFGWSRIGAALVRILRVILKIPVGIYVDDLHGAERPECIKHTNECVARLIKCVLGRSSVATHKVAHGLPMQELLGATVDADDFGVSFCPNEEKVVKWCDQIRDILRRKHLPSGAGKKLAGKLSWSAQLVFCRLGRAMLRPLYKIKRGETWSLEIESALVWFLEILSMQVVQVRPWIWPSSRPVQIYCDAAGSPARLAAIVFTEDGRAFYSDVAPPQSLLDYFTDRSDNQICSLELCAIALGLSTFGDFCKGRKVHVWSDNAGSEWAVRRGSAKAWDHNEVVHAIWVKAAALRCHMRVDRVPTELNIADLPSRFSYDLLREIHATYVPPVLDEFFWNEQAWSTIWLKDNMN